MPTLNKHVHLLFDEESYKYLKGLAKSQKSTLGELVRSAVQKVYGSGGTNQKKEAAQFLLSQNHFPVKDPQEMKKEYLGFYEKKRIH